MVHALYVFVAVIVWGGCPHQVMVVTRALACMRTGVISGEVAPRPKREEEGRRGKGVGGQGKRMKVVWGVAGRVWISGWVVTEGSSLGTGARGRWWRGRMVG